MNRFGKLNNPFKKFTDNHGLLLVVLIQLCLVSFAFDKIIFHGTGSVFNNSYDGIKNYFTLQGYVSEPRQNDYLKFGLMNYPYGDYIYYTDNTPLFSLCERIILHDVLHQPARAIFYFNLFILSGVLLSSVILFKLFRHFSPGVAFAILFSIALPWFSPQMMRMNGHFNLSFSCILLLVIYLLVKRDKGPALKNDIALGVVIFLSGFIHLYYLLISLVFVLSFFSFNALNDLLRKRKWLAGFIRGTGFCIAAFALFFLVLRVTDDYYPLRRTSAEGYDWDSWKLQFRALYTPYFYHPLSNLFPKLLDYESFAYLGTGTLIGIFGIVVFLVTHPTKLKSIFAEARGKTAFKILSLLLLATLPGLLIALGENIHISGDFFITNYLSPFFYLRKIVPQITHFRCLGRFAWYFFWIANCFTLFIVCALISKRYFKILLSLMLCGFLVDLFFALKYSSVAYEMPNPFDKTALAETAKTFGTINPSGYQALLAFPFYHVGSEDYRFTIDPEDNFCVKTFQLSLASHLPLINSKMSRTPLQYTYNIFSVFEPAGINDSLLHDLNDKPVLVYLDKTFYDHDTLLTNKTPLVGQMPAKEIAKHGHEIIKKWGMRNLMETESYAWYEWKPSVNDQKLGHVLR